MTYDVEISVVSLPEKIRRLIHLEPHPELDSPCWLYTGRLNRNGYGRIRWRGKEPVVHRVVWVMLKEPILPGLLLDHRCERRACCNPAHLEPVTVQVNTLRGRAVLFKRMATASACHMT